MPGMVDPRNFGAKADGVTDDTTAIQATLTAGYDVALHGTYVVSTVTVPQGRTIYGPGTLKSSSNAAMLSLSGDDVTVFCVRFEGDGKGASLDAGKSGQHAISINAKYHAAILGCRGTSLGGALVYVTQTVGAYEGTQILGCVADACNKGIYCGPTGEYVTVSGFTATGCNLGLHIAAGNFHGSGCNVSGNTTGVLIDVGTNDAHGTIVRSAINHCTTAIQFNAIQNGFTISDCDIYAGAIVLNGTDASTRCIGVAFESCKIDVGSYSFKASNAMFRNCLLPGSEANTITNDASGTTSRTLWIDCRPLATFARTIVEYDGGFSRVTNANAVTWTPANITAEQTIKPDTIGLNSLTNHAAYTRDTFYSTSTGVWTVVGLGSGMLRMRSNIKLTKNAGDTFAQIYVYLRKNGSFYAYLPIAQTSAITGEVCACIDVPCVAGDAFDLKIGGTVANNLVLAANENFVEVSGL